MNLLITQLIFLLGSGASLASSDCLLASKPGAICLVDLNWVRPTQGAVGELEVRAKRSGYREELDLAFENGNPEKHYDEFLQGKKRKLEMVLGPPKAGSKKPTLYIIDRHHTSRALFLEFENLSPAKQKELGGYPKGFGHIAANLTHLSQEQFEEVMERPYEYFKRNPRFFSPDTEIHERTSWVRLKDANGNRLKTWSALPQHLSELPNDPFRSVAWMLRESDAFRKSLEPFVEFQLADRLRKDFDRDEIVKLVTKSPEDAGRLLGGWATQHLDTMGLEVGDGEEAVADDLVSLCQENFKKLVKKSKNIP